MATTQDLGLVTSYGYALAGGYRGTEEEYKVYLANLGTVDQRAEASARAAAASAADADTAYNNTLTVYNNTVIAKDQAVAAKDLANTYATNASMYVAQAAAQATNAAQSAADALQSENDAFASEQGATRAMNAALQAEADAQAQVALAHQEYLLAEQERILSESWAEGGTGARVDENVHNSEYWAMYAKAIADGLSGVIFPMGTIWYADLPNTAPTGAMYNIKDDFITDSRFVEGPGTPVAAGSNCYMTISGLWDVMAGGGVTGVKAEAETQYSTGNVTITRTGMGLGNVTNNRTTYDVNEPTGGENGDIWIGE